MSTDCSPNSPSTTCRRRRGSSIQLLRSAQNDSCLPHNDTRELAQKRFMRWTACFGFVAKLKKSKHKLELPSLPESMIRRHSSAVTQSDRSCITATTPSSRQSPARPMSQLVERHDQDTSSLVTGFPWNDPTPPLLHDLNQKFPSPATPLSALSPPPRHAMKERSRSLTVEDTPPLWPSCSSIPSPKPRRKANTIGRSLALRLSLDVEQHYSSSITSNNSIDYMKKREDGYSSACNTSEHSKHDTSSNNSSGSSSSSNSSCSSATTASTSPDDQQQQQQRKLRLSSIEAPPCPQLSEKRLSLKERRQRVSTVLQDIEKLTISVNESDSSTTAYPDKENEKEYNDDDDDDEDDEDDDYDDLLNEFQLPSEILPTMDNKEKSIQEYHRRPPIPFPNASSHPTSRISNDDSSRQEAMDALEGAHRMDQSTPRASMDIVRDKAYYDAVVAGTLHRRRPWNQFLRAQSMIVGDNQQGDFKETPQQHDQHYLSSPPIHHEKEDRTRASSAIFNHRPSLIYFPPSPNSIESYYNS